MSRTDASSMQDLRVVIVPDPVDLARSRAASSRLHPFAALPLHFGDSRLDQTKLALFNALLVVYSSITRLLSPPRR